MHFQFLRRSAVEFTLLGLCVAATSAWSEAVVGPTSPDAPAAATARPRLPIGATPGATFDLAWVARIIRVSDPQFAPDGKTLAAVVTRSDYEEDLNVAELAAIDIATGKERYLTHDRKSVSFPRWSPQGYINTPIESILPVIITHTQTDDEQAAITEGFRPVLTPAAKNYPIFRFFPDWIENQEFVKNHLQPVFWYCRGAMIKPGVGIKAR